MGKGGTPPVAGQKVNSSGGTFQLAKAEPCDVMTGPRRAHLTKAEPLQRTDWTGVSNEPGHWNKHARCNNAPKSQRCVINDLGQPTINLDSWGIGVVRDS